MPFVSSQQRRLFYAKQRRGEMSQATIDRWNEETKAQQASGELPKKLPKLVDKKASEKLKGGAIGGLLGAAAGHSLGSRFGHGAVGTVAGAALGAGAGSALFGAKNKPRAPSPEITDFRRRDAQYQSILNDRGVGHDHVDAVAARRRLGLNSDHSRHLKTRQQVAFFFGPSKTASMDPKTLFAQAMQGALAGAIAGSRRSLDDATLQGVAQGAAIGALGGVLGGQIQGGQGQAGALIGGAGAGFVASRGPRGDSRPDLHLRIDRGTGAPLPGPQQKQASEARDQQRARAQAKGRAAGLAVRKHMEENRGFSSVSGAVRNAANAVASSPDAIGAFHRALTKGASSLGHAAELAGLGILAAPTVAEMRGRKVSDKTKHRAELAGLGVLAAPSAIHLGGKAVNKIKGLAKGIAKRAEDIKGDADKVDAERAAIKATPLGERVLADVDGANESPRVARAFLRRLMARTIAEPRQLK